MKISWRRDKTKSNWKPKVTRSFKGQEKHKILRQDYDLVLFDLE